MLKDGDIDGEDYDDRKEYIGSDVFQTESQNSIGYSTISDQEQQLIEGEEGLNDIFEEEIDQRKDNLGGENVRNCKDGNFRSSPLSNSTRKIENSENQNQSIKNENIMLINPFKGTITPKFHSGEANIMLEPKTPEKINVKKSMFSYNTINKKEQILEISNKKVSEFGLSSPNRSPRFARSNTKKNMSFSNNLYSPNYFKRRKLNTPEEKNENKQIEENNGSPLGSRDLNLSKSVPQSPLHHNKPHSNCITDKKQSYQHISSTTLEKQNNSNKDDLQIPIKAREQAEEYQFGRKNIQNIHLGKISKKLFFTLDGQLCSFNMDPLEGMSPFKSTKLNFEREKQGKILKIQEVTENSIFVLQRNTCTNKSTLNGSETNTDDSYCNDLVVFDSELEEVKRFPSKKCPSINLYSHDNSTIEDANIDYEDEIDRSIVMWFKNPMSLSLVKIEDFEVVELQLSKGKNYSPIILTEQIMDSLYHRVDVFSKILRKKIIFSVLLLF